MKYFSAFTGIGGFDLGIDLVSSDSECVGYSEVDKYAIKIYKKHFTDRINYGDIRGIISDELPDFDMLCGGFPCQDLSIAGKRKGLRGKRSGLFFELVRIIREKQPKLILLENVKGLLSSNGGWDFATVLVELEESGYDVEWQVLNSKNFGVPQNRERAFIIGHLRGKPWEQIFPLREVDKRSIGRGQGIRGEILPKNRTAEGDNIEIRLLQDGENGHIRNNIIQVNHPNHSQKRVYDADGLSPYLNTMQGGCRQPKIVTHSLFPRSSTSGEGGTGHLVKDDGIAYCLDTGNNQAIEGKATGIRRLTPIECERLQGFPDNWTEGISDTQRYKCLGNAVTVNVISEIIRQIGA